MNAVTTRSGKAALIQLQLEPHRAELVDKLVQLARAGDPRSLQLALSYLGPPEEHVHVLGLSAAKTLADRTQCIVAAVAEGHCSVTAAQKLMQIVDLVARTAEIDELRERMDRLEKRGVLDAGDIA
jgi:hypothetical protein